MAIFLFKRFGKEKFIGIEKAGIEIWPVLPEGRSAGDLERDGHIFIDLGGGAFDHHDQRGKTTASQLVADYLGVAEDPSIAKLTGIRLSVSPSAKYGRASVYPSESAINFQILLVALSSA